MMDFEKIDELDNQISIIAETMNKIEDEYEAKGKCAENTPLWLRYHKKVVALDAKKYQLVWPESQIEFNESKTGFQVKTNQNPGWLVT